MRKVIRYEAADGTLHKDERAAKARDEDFLGEELDGLLRLAFNLDVHRQECYRAILYAMKHKDELSKAITTIAQILQHGQHSE